MCVGEELREHGNTTSRRRPGRIRSKQTLLVRAGAEQPGSHAAWTRNSGLAEKGPSSQMPDRPAAEAHAKSRMQSLPCCGPSRPGWSGRGLCPAVARVPWLLWPKGHPAASFSTKRAWVACACQPSPTGTFLIAQRRHGSSGQPASTEVRLATAACMPKPLQQEDLTKPLPPTALAPKYAKGASTSRLGCMLARLARKMPVAA